ncbi:MAG: universal stress protein [Anaerolineae bacterium]|nr:universal stress protein [Anaerolineae bacterium]
MYHTILVPLDGSNLSERALPLATAFAKASDAQLVLVRSVWVPRLSDITPEEEEVKAVDEAEEYLADLAFKLGAQGLQVQTAVPYAPAAEGILMEIELRHADLVVMSTHGRSGLSRLIYGSVAEAILAHSPTPVLLVRVTKDEAAQTSLPDDPQILVPLDGSEFAEVALPYASELARALNGTLVLLRAVVPPPQWVDTVMTVPYPTEEVIVRGEEDARAYLHDLAEHLKADGLRVKMAVEVGHADEVILRLEKGPIQLVVMATHGRTGLAQAVFGSVAVSVMHRGNLPLLIVRPKGMTPPVGAKASEEPTPMAVMHL